MNEEQVQKIKNHLKLIEAQAATLADELKAGNIWGQDEKAKIGTIYRSMTSIGILSER